MPAEDPRSDSQLVAALNRGDVSAFDALYFRYRDWVVRLAQRVTGHNDDALDVMQETFTYLFGKFPDFVLTARLTTFLYPVVKNLSIAARRKRGRHTSDVPLTDPAAPAAEDEDRQRQELAAALASLPEGQREVLLMRFVDDLKLSEIAEALGVPEGTVKSRLHNALARLKEDHQIREYFDNP